MQQQLPLDTLLTDDDVRLIALGAATFPGKWYLDPLVDSRRPGKPRAWVRADELADHRVNAIAFERSIGLVLVTLCRDDEDEQTALPNRVYESLETALSCTREDLCFRVSIDMAQRTRLRRLAETRHKANMMRSQNRSHLLWQPFRSMLRLTAWSIGLMGRVTILWCYDLVLRPFTRRSMDRRERMELRWDRLCEEADDLVANGEQLHMALLRRWDL